METEETKTPASSEQLNPKLQVSVDQPFIVVVSVPLMFFCFSLRQPFLLLAYLPFCFPPTFDPFLELKTLLQHRVTTLKSQAISNIIKKVEDWVDMSSAKSLISSYASFASSMAGVGCAVLLLFHLLLQLQHPQQIDFATGKARLAYKYTNICNAVQEDGSTDGRYR